MSGLAVGLLLALTGIAALLLAALLLLNQHHRRRDLRILRLRRALGPMLASPAGRDRTLSEPVWLDDLSCADGRSALLVCLEALPRLSPTAADRVRDVLHRSRAARRAIDDLSHASAARRIEGCRMAGRLGDRGAMALLVQRLEDPDFGVRREAIRALGELGAVEAVGAIAETIEGMGEWTNLLLLMALVRMGPRGAPAIGSLLAASTDRSPDMIKALLQVTSRIGLAADPQLVRTLASHREPEVRVEAVRVLGSIAPEPSSVDTCLAAMDDAEWPVRAIAASSLGRLGDERTLPRLARSMGDPAYWVRHHVAEAMASLGEPGADALRQALHDGNPFVRDMAAQALFMRALADGEAA